KWFIGGGLTAVNAFNENSRYRGIGLALFPTGGAEYKFPRIPLAVSADLRPTFSIAGKFRDHPGINEFYPGNVGIAARYTFR
ncbi:MAG: hypothetical protein ABW174_06455, partial [Flavitalea sp.]